MSENNSRRVSSSQVRMHPRLAQRVQRHLAAPWRKPAQAADAAALRELESVLANAQQPLILDSFCGTGESTATLARRFPRALIIGIDKSAQRLGRHQRSGSDNYLLLQAHCEAVWRHLVQAGVRLQAHYLSYPNPWPKPGQLGRRVHGHPSFPLLLQLGGIMELRSNWQVYVEEFGTALHLAGAAARIGVIAMDEPALSAFERKYRGSGHTLWRLTANLNGVAASGDSDS